MSESNRQFALTLLRGSFAIVRLAADSRLPQWATDGEFFSATRTSGELSIVCAAGRVPDNVVSERGWRVLKVNGVFALSEVGVLATLSASLAAAEVSLFVISTFDTDYLLVNEKQLDHAIAALRRGGHRVEPDGNVS
jgi:uncharacterized protein